MSALIGLGLVLLGYLLGRRRPLRAARARSYMRMTLGLYGPFRGPRWWQVLVACLRIAEWSLLNPDLAWRAFVRPRPKPEPASAADFLRRRPQASENQAGEVAP